MLCGCGFVAEGSCLSVNKLYTQGHGRMRIANGCTEVYTCATNIFFLGWPLLSRHRQCCCCATLLARRRSTRRRARREGGGGRSEGFASGRARACGPLAFPRRPVRTYAARYEAHQPRHQHPPGQAQSCVVSQLLKVKPLTESSARLEAEYNGTVQYM